MIKNSIRTHIDLDNMILLCIKHGEPVEGKECRMCIEEEMRELKDILDEAERRKQWENRHKKTLGE